MFVYTFYQRFAEDSVALREELEKWLTFKLQAPEEGLLRIGGSRRGAGGTLAESPGEIGELGWTAFELSHGDSEVSGRLWRVSAGVRRLAEGGCEASAVTEVDDVSTLAATTPPEITRPSFVTQWLRRFKPQFSPQIPASLETLADLNDLISAVQDPGRIHPVLIVSMGSRGKPGFEVGDLEKRTEGLLQIIRVGARFDTRDPLYQGQRWGVYRGGAALIFPAMRHWQSNEVFVPVERYSPDQLDALDLSNQDVALYLYHRFLHRTNLAFVRQHLGPERLRVARNERDNSALIRQLLESTQPSSEQLEGVRQLSAALDAANERARQAEKRAGEIEQHYYDAQQSADDAEAKAAESLRRAQALEAQLDKAREVRAKAQLPAEPVRQAVAKLLAKADISPEETLHVIAHSFPDRVAVLDTAYKSAKEAAIFRKPDKVSLRLKQLAIEYVDGMRSGHGDRAGLEIFGKDDYAAKESEIREDSAGSRRKRTFTYKGHAHYMERHLKIDTGRSAADGWRCHFTWLAEESRVIIGYCGKHLDFK